MNFFQQAEQGVHTFNLLAIILSLPLVLLIWATIAFAVSIVTFAWRGVDTAVLDASRGDDAHMPNLSSFLFGMPTAWVATGLLVALVATAVGSFWLCWQVGHTPGLLSVRDVDFIWRQRCGHLQRTIAKARDKNTSLSVFLAHGLA
jgi:hypothetical protein